MTRAHGGYYLSRLRGVSENGMHHRTSLAALSLLVVASGILGCVAPEGATEPTTEDALVGAPSACTQVVDARNNQVATLEVADGLLTIAQSSDDGRFPPMSHGLRRVMLVVEPDEKSTVKVVPVPLALLTSVSRPALPVACDDAPSRKSSLSLSTKSGSAFDCSFACAVQDEWNVTLPSGS
jgi:hypothetical protein